MLSQRVCDGVFTRLVGKWLKAGVMEAGVVRHPESGTPQGGVISPLLANVYLHEVLDTRLVIGTGLVVVGIVVVGLRYDQVVSLVTRRRSRP